ncbi:MAG: hypothetical protein FWF80_04645 [Defluviitaleaceae bacterium]|nr:hypothetical protein [Defluviitaleaceae bacterium]
MNEKKSFFKSFYQNLASCFTSSIMGITLARMAFSEMMNDGLFRLNEGLPFEGILQFFLWSCILSGLTVVLTEDIWFGKVMLLWRLAVLMLLAVAVSVGFAIVFRWFPTDLWYAWAAFMGFFTVGFGSGLVVAVIKTKRTDRRYNKLLSDYKSKQKEGLQ